MRLELQWWSAALATKPVRLLTQELEIDDVLEIWVDASSAFGIGAVIDGEWLAWRWKEGWKGFGQDGHNIGWAEMIGIELVVRALAVLGKTDCNCLIRSDNKGAIDAIKKGASRNIPSNQSIIRINSIRVPLNIDISPSYVTSEQNRADPVSRGDYSGLHRSHIQIDLPPLLSAVLVHV